MPDRLANLAHGLAIGGALCAAFKHGVATAAFCVIGGRNPYFWYPNTDARPHPAWASLASERLGLVEKELTGSLTPAQASRLATIRQQLDYIEDVEMGDHLDQLEQLAEASEKMSERIEDFTEQLRRVSPTVFAPRESKRR